MGFQAGPIPFTAIICYADEYGFEGDMRHDLIYFVKKIDRAILSALAAERKAKDGAKESGKFGR